MSKEKRQEPIPPTGKETSRPLIPLESPYPIEHLPPDDPIFGEPLTVFVPFQHQAEEDADGDVPQAWRGWTRRRHGC
ncbi:MAG TPA: hypothetical protein VFB38_17950 [Chthonomonadaceae bacterium]|nr:hypothetical protein [Chthonomonadaceae bacterium]